MSQTVILEELKDKRRRKYWEFKDADENDWRRQLFKHELANMTRLIEYLQGSIKRH